MNTLGRRHRATQMARGEPACGGQAAARRAEGSNHVPRMVIACPAFPCREAVTGAIFALFALLCTVAAAQQLPSEKVLPLALASEAAVEAVAECERQGYRVSAAVVDGAGLIKALIRGDGAAPHTLDSSSRKAYTSASLRQSTSELVELIRGNPDATGLRRMNENILILGGGLPIKSGAEVIGGIGVGGAPGGHLDEACARAGIDKIRDRLR